MIDKDQKITLSPEHSDLKFSSLENLSELELSEYMKSIINDIEKMSKIF